MSRAAFTVQVSDLVGNPGRRREVALSGPLDVTLPQGRTTEEPADVTARLDATTDGVVAHGDVGAAVILTCTRCLREVEHRQTAAFDQVFGFVESDDIEPVSAEGEIDLEGPVRDELALSLPLSAVPGRLQGNLPNVWEPT